NIFIFHRDDLVSSFHDSDFAAEVRKKTCKFKSYDTSADHSQPGRNLIKCHHIITGQDDIAVKRQKRQSFRERPCGNQYILVDEDFTFRFFIFRALNSDCTRHGREDGRSQYTSIAIEYVY